MTARLARNAQRVSHPVFARVLPAMSQAMEAGGLVAHRQSLLAGLGGQVIEVGAGTGPASATIPPPSAR